MTKLSSVAGLLGGSPAAIDEALRRFSESASLLDADRQRLVEEYAERWIGVHDGQVEIVGTTLDDLKSRAQRRGIPLQEMVVSYIDRDEFLT